MKIKKIGIIKESINQKTKGDQFALVLFHEFNICPMCESTLELGL